MTNKLYAHVGGILVHELNAFERLLCIQLNFRLRVEPEEYRLYHNQIVKLFGPVPVQGGDMWQSDCCGEAFFGLVAFGRYFLNLEPGLALAGFCSRQQKLKMSSEKAAFSGC